MSWLEDIKKPVPILIVDDDSMDRSFFEIGTGAFHRELIQAGSGEEALEILKSRTDIKLVILDERLPGMSGLDTFKQIKMLSHPHPWVLFLTGYGGDFVSAVNKIGCAMTVAKPMADPREFLTDLMEQIGIPHRPDCSPCI
jgi:CheY-like chemotaxis protein